MNIEQAKKNIFAAGLIPDGYNGNNQKVFFSLINSKVVTIAPCGYFGSGLPDVIDNKEAYWILKNHPAAGYIKDIVKV